MHLMKFRCWALAPWISLNELCAVFPSSLCRRGPRVPLIMWQISSYSWFKEDNVCLVHLFFSMPEPISTDVLAQFLDLAPDNIPSLGALFFFLLWVAGVLLRLSTNSHSLPSFSPPPFLCFSLHRIWFHNFWEWRHRRESLWNSFSWNQ